MSWLLESPVWIVAIGVAVVAICGGGWVKTGHRAFIALVIAAVLCTLALFVLERLVVTDREAVRSKLHQMARDVEKNNLDLVLSHIHSQAPPSIASKVRSEFPRHTFRSVDIKPNVQIDVFPDRRPPRAEAKFLVELNGDFVNGQYPGQRVLLSVLIIFNQEDDGEWKLADYEYELAQDALFRRRSSSP